MNTTMIIMIICVIVLICCCLISSSLGAGGYAYTNNTQPIGGSKPSTTAVKSE